MNAQELRIGNYLYSGITNTVFQVTAEDLFNISKGEDEGKVKPIELTDKILINIGFIENELKGIKLINVHDDYYICFVNNGRSINVDIKFLHQLQNLYFALTGEELTLTNKK
jgi:hypothetical protein